MVPFLKCRVQSKLKEGSGEGVHCSSEGGRGSSTGEIEVMLEGRYQGNAAVVITTVMNGLALNSLALREGWAALQFRFSILQELGFSLNVTGFGFRCRL